MPKGPYIVDFACADAKLVVELDGGHHSERIAYDARRTQYLEGLGWRVIRFWNHEILEGRDDVCRAILHACGGEVQPPLPPSEAREGRG